MAVECQGWCQVGGTHFCCRLLGHHKTLAGRVSFISRWSTVRRRSWHLSARRIALRVFLLKWLEGFEKLKDASSSQVNSSMLRNVTFRRWLFQFCKHASPIGESLELCKWMSSLPTSSHTMRATEDLGALFPLICKSLCCLLWCFSDASAGYGIISNLPKFSSAAELHTDCWRSWGLESPEWLLMQDDENEASGLSGESAKEELASKTFARSHALFAFSPCEMQSPHLCCSLGRTSLINYLHVNSYLRANL